LDSSGVVVSDSFAKREISVLFKLKTATDLTAWMPVRLIAKRVLSGRHKEVSMQVAEIMTRHTEVVPSNLPLKEAAQKMQQLDVDTLQI